MLRARSGGDGWGWKFGRAQPMEKTYPAVGSGNLCESLLSLPLRHTSNGRDDVSLLSTANMRLDFSMCRQKQGPAMRSPSTMTHFRNLLLISPVHTLFEISPPCESLANIRSQILTKDGSLNTDSAYPYFNM